MPAAVTARASMCCCSDYASSRRCRFQNLLAVCTTHPRDDLLCLAVHAAGCCRHGVHMSLQCTCKQRTYAGVNMMWDQRSYDTAVRDASISKHARHACPCARQLAPTTVSCRLPAAACSSCCFMACVQHSGNKTGVSHPVLSRAQAMLNPMSQWLYSGWRHLKHTIK